MKPVPVNADRFFYGYGSVLLRCVDDSLRGADRDIEDDHDEDEDEEEMIAHRRRLDSNLRT